MRSHPSQTPTPRPDGQNVTLTSTLGRVLVEITILQSTHGPNESAKALREGAEFYKVDVAAITSKVKQEFAAKEKAQATRKAPDKAKPNQQPTTATKKAKAA